MIRPFVATAKKKYFRIGVVGYSAKYFNKTEAETLLREGFKQALKHNKNKYSVEIVSGLTDMGIPALAYKIATEKDYRTSGYACKKAEDMVQFNVDKANIIGNSWGAESEEFLANIDVLIRIGGSSQSRDEAKTAKENGLPVFEYELDELHSLCLMGYLDPKIAKNMHEQIKGKARELFKPSDYHITIRYWLYNPTDKAHKNKVIKYLKDRFEHPVAFDVKLTGDTDIWGPEKSYVYHLDGHLLYQFQKEIDSALQDLGAPKSDYPTYRAHITVGEQLEFKPKIDIDNIIINKWRLSTKVDHNTESQVIWESDLVYKTASRVVIARFEQLKEVKNVDDILDFLVFRSSDEVIDKCVFDHLLLEFMSQLPGFDTRHDFDEQEITQFKQMLRYEDLRLDRNEISEIIKPFRSVNRMIDELVHRIPEKHKKEIAHDHIRNFWFQKVFGGDVAAFVNGLKGEFWNPTAGNG